MNVIAHQLRRGRATSDEPVEGSKILAGCQPCHVKPWNAGLETLVQDGVAVGGLEPPQDCLLRKIRHALDINVIAGGEDDVVHLHVRPAGNTHVQRAMLEDLA